jgi:hypothetical protein
VVNRCAIHHDGFVFDKGGEALVGSPCSGAERCGLQHQLASARHRAFGAERPFGVFIRPEQAARGHRKNQQPSPNRVKVDHAGQEITTLELS